MTREQSSAAVGSAAISQRRAPTPGSASGELPASSFALKTAWAMLIVNLIGFAPTLYLRPLFDVPPIPAYLYAHGLVGTAWFVLTLVQTKLVHHRNIVWHRRLGWAAATLALIVLVSGVYTSTNMVPRAVAIGATSEAKLTLYRLVTAGDLASFLVFPTLVALGVCFRRRKAVHFRLMLLASLSIIGPAAARIWSWFGDIPNPRPIVLGIILGFVISFVWHDIRSLRRIHPATLSGIFFIIAVNAAMQLSGIGETIVAQRLGQ